MPRKKPRTWSVLVTWYRYKHSYMDTCIGKLRDLGYEPIIRYHDGYLHIYVGLYKQYLDVLSLCEDIKGAGFRHAYVARIKGSELGSEFLRR